VGPRHGLFRGLCRLGGIGRDFEHGGVHLLHGLGRVPQAFGLFLGTPAGQLDLMGQLGRGRGDHPDDILQGLGGLEHALGLGPPGGPRGFLGDVGRFKGRLGLTIRFLGLAVGQVDLVLEGGHHAGDGVRQFAQFPGEAPLRFGVEITGGHARGIGPQSVQRPDDIQADPPPRQADDHGQHAQGGKPHGQRRRGGFRLGLVQGGDDDEGAVDLAFPPAFLDAAHGVRGALGIAVAEQAILGQADCLIVADGVGIADELLIAVFFPKFLENAFLFRTRGVVGVAGVFLGHPKGKAQASHIVADHVDGGDDRNGL